ncbi:MAG: dockerin type I repeat-containing protein, partial [Clostridia bacterium]|nr:dockerin type I repeat-containing protein [Clostridia bacterium]
YQDTTELIEAITFRDLQMTGPRAAMYWLGNNPDYPYINVVSNITEKWVYMPDGTNGVKDYFEANYEDGRVDYPTQTPQTDQWRTPETPLDVHPFVHYSQLGYNEIGRDAMRNTCYLLGEAEIPKYEASVKLLSWDGFNSYGDEISPDLCSESLAVPVASPLFLSKNITVEVPEDSQYSYYDLTGIYGGEIKVSLEDITLNVNLKDKQAVKYNWTVSDNELTSVTENGESSNVLVNTDNLPAVDGVFSGTRYSMERKVVLRHDLPWSVEWRSAGGEYMLLSSTENAYTEGNLYIHVSKSNNGVSVGRRININGKLQYDSYGVNLSDHGVSVADVHTYCIANEVQGSSNYLWLYVDGEKVAQLTAHNIMGVWDGSAGELGNGQDFIFSYIGAKPYALRNVALEYIIVNEGIEEKPEVTVGDVDGDGEITMLDLFRLKLFVKQKALPTDVEIAAGDIDGDGEITMVDSFEMKYRISKGYWRNQ